MDLISLKDAVSHIVDNRGKTCPTSDAGMPLIATNCVKSSSLYPTKEKIRYVDAETYETWFRGHPEPGDILFVNKGSPGEVCLVPDPVDFCIAQDMVSLRANEKKIDPSYFFAVLRDRRTKTAIENMHVGTMIPHFKKTDFDKLNLPLPPRSDQEFIGQLYLDLSKRIALNQKMNQTLEEIAKAIFKSWFVDFDPVRAKAEGRPTGLSPEVSDLFPDELVDSEIGEIPRGWEVTSLGDVCEQVTKGTTPTSVGGKFSEDGNILFVKVESVSEDGQLLPSKFAKIDEETDSLLKRSQLREGDVLLSIAGTIGRSTIMPKRFLPANTNQALAILRCSGKEDFVLQTLRSDHIQQNFHSKIVQAVQANLSLGEIKATRCVLPPLGVHDQLIDMIKKIREANEIRDQETSILAELRDTLLPKLISGELRIPDAEKFLEEAGI